MQQSEADIILQTGKDYNIPCQVINRKGEIEVLIDNKVQILNFDAAKLIIKGLILEKTSTSAEIRNKALGDILKLEDEEPAPIFAQEERQTSLKIDNKETLFSYPTILVFTSQRNVCKVKNLNFLTITQVIDHSEMDGNEKPIYITGIKNYTGYLIVGFENGKVGKIAMESFQTEFNRKKLKGAFSGDSRLVFIEHIENEIDLIAVSSIDKVVLFNTSQINAVGSRTTLGVQVMKPKDRSLMTKIKKLDQVKLQDPEYYRKAEGLNAVGFYLKDGDAV